MRFIKIIASAFLLLLIGLFLAIRGPSLFRGRQTAYLGSDQVSAEQPAIHPVPSPTPETRQAAQATNESERKSSEQTSSREKSTDREEKSTETRSATRQRMKSDRASVSENRRRMKIECVKIADSQCSSGQRTTVFVMQPVEDLDVDEESVDYERPLTKRIYIDDFDDDDYYESSHHDYGPVDYAPGYDYEEDEMDDSTSAPAPRWVILAVPKPQECPVPYENWGAISDPY